VSNVLGSTLSELLDELANSDGDRRLVILDRVIRQVQDDASFLQELKESLYNIQAECDEPALVAEALQAADEIIVIEAQHAALAALDAGYYQYAVNAVACCEAIDMDQVASPVRTQMVWTCILSAASTSESETCFQLVDLAQRLDRDGTQKQELTVFRELLVFYFGLEETKVDCEHVAHRCANLCCLNDLKLPLKLLSLELRARALERLENREAEIAGIKTWLECLRASDSMGPCRDARPENSEAIHRHLRGRARMEHGLLLYSRLASLYESRANGMEPAREIYEDFMRADLAAWTDPRFQGQSIEARYRVLMGVSNRETSPRGRSRRDTLILRPVERRFSGIAAADTIDKVLDSIERDLHLGTCGVILSDPGVREFRFRFDPERGTAFRQLLKAIAIQCRKHRDFRTRKALTNTNGRDASEVIILRYVGPCKGLHDCAFTIAVSNPLEGQLAIQFRAVTITSKLDANTRARMTILLQRDLKEFPEFCAVEDMARKIVILSARELDQRASGSDSDDPEEFAW